MVPRTSIIPESEVSIAALYLWYMFTPLHSSTNQALFEKYTCNQGNHFEKYHGAACPSYCLKLKYPLPFPVSYV